MKQQDEFKIVELLIINKASIEISTYQRFTFVFSVSWNWPFENGAHEYVKTHARAHTYIYISNLATKTKSVRACRDNGRALKARVLSIQREHRMKNPPTTHLETPLNKI